MLRYFPIYKDIVELIDRRYARSAVGVKQVHWLILRYPRPTRWFGLVGQHTIADAQGSEGPPEPATLLSVTCCPLLQFDTQLP